MSAQGRISGLPEVAVRYVDRLADHLPNGAIIGPGTEAAPGALLVSLAEAGRGLARGGSDLEFWRAPDADPELVACLLHQSLRAALIHQRGDIPLNGAALVGPAGRAIVLSGLAGVGKSVAAYALVQRGWHLLADGIARVQIVDGRPQIVPSDIAIQLWKDACENLGIDDGNMARVRRSMAKFHVPVAASTSAVPLGCVVDCVQFAQSGVMAMPADEARMILSRNSFRPRQIRAMDCMAQHLRAVESVAANVPVVRLLGVGKCAPLELADRLEEIRL